MRMTFPSGHAPHNQGPAWRSRVGPRRRRARLLLLLPALALLLALPLAAQQVSDFQARSRSQIAVFLPSGTWEIQFSSAPPLSEPPLELVQQSLRGFDTGLRAPVPGVPGDNFIAAATRAAEIAPPFLAALQEPAELLSVVLSQNAEPVQEADGSLTWTYVDGDFQATLRVVIDDVNQIATWEMRVTDPNANPPLDDFLCFAGEAEIDAGNGFLDLYDKAQAPNQVATHHIEWSSDGENLEASITVTDPNDAAAGDVLTLSKEGDAVLLTFLDASAQATTEIFLDLATLAGYLIDPNYNNGEQACWDENLQDVDCQAQPIPLNVMTDSVAAAGGITILGGGGGRDADTAPGENVLVGLQVLADCLPPIGEGLAEPADAIATAISGQEEPTEDADGKLHWVYDDGTLRLELIAWAEEQPEQVFWQMLKSDSSANPPLDNFLYFEGQTTFDSLEGDLTLYDQTQPDAQAPISRLDWNIGDIIGVELALTILDELSEDNGTVYYFHHDGETVTNSCGGEEVVEDEEEGIIVIGEALREFVIVPETKVGSVVDPEHNNGERACWDERLQDVECSAAPPQQNVEPLSLEVVSTEAQGFNSSLNPFGRAPTLPGQNAHAAANVVIELVPTAVEAIREPAELLSLAVSQQEEPIQEADGSFNWYYDDGQLQLHLKVLVDEQAQVASAQLFVTDAAAGLQDFLYLDGQADLDGGTGFVDVFDRAQPQNPTRTHRVEWEMGDQGEVTIRLEENPDDANAGRLLTLTKVGTVVTLNSVDKATGEETEVSIDLATREGYVIDPDYNNGEPACWDGQFQDVAC